LATFALWTANFIVSQTFPMLDDNPWLMARFHHGFPFYVYGLFCAVLVAVVCLFLPETKGRSLEEIEALWTRRTKT
jgi:MFS transporter, SP family, xylose:H+ symportor